MCEPGISNSMNHRCDAPFIRIIYINSDIAFCLDAESTECTGVPCRTISAQAATKQYN